MVDRMDKGAQRARLAEADMPPEMVAALPPEMVAAVIRALLDRPGLGPSARPGHSTDADAEHWVSRDFAYAFRYETGTRVGALLDTLADAVAAWDARHRWPGPLPAHGPLAKLAEHARVSMAWLLTRALEGRRASGVERWVVRDEDEPAGVRLVRDEAPEVAVQTPAGRDALALTFLLDVALAVDGDAGLWRLAVALWSLPGSPVGRERALAVVAAFGALSSLEAGVVHESVLFYLLPLGEEEDDYRLPPLLEQYREQADVVFGVRDGLRRMLTTVHELALAWLLYEDSPSPEWTTFWARLALLPPDATAAPAVPAAERVRPLEEMPPDRSVWYLWLELVYPAQLGRLPDAALAPTGPVGRALYRDLAANPYDLPRNAALFQVLARLTLDQLVNVVLRALPAPLTEMRAAWLANALVLLPMELTDDADLAALWPHLLPPAPATLPQETALVLASALGSRHPRRAHRAWRLVKALGRVASRAPRGWTTRVLDYLEWDVRADDANTDTTTKINLTRAFLRVLGTPTAVDIIVQLLLDQTCRAPDVGLMFFWLLAHAPEERALLEAARRDLAAPGTADDMILARALAPDAPTPDDAAELADLVAAEETG